MTNYEAIDLENIANNPVCPHGPTILFEKQDDSKKKFFSCSACRDFKACQFYQLEKEEFTQDDLEKWQNIYDQNQPAYKEAMLNLKKIKQMRVHKRIYCKTCNKFIVKKKLKSKCAKLDHELLVGITNKQLARPSSFILNAKAKDETNAQYFFDNNTNEYLKSIIAQNAYDSVLCIGTPSLFEKLKELKGVKRLLMDIDDRFMQFFSKKLFIRFNMFNNHFFYVDPPYGGIVKLISNTINLIKKDCPLETKIDTVLFYPYFMETWIKRWLPNLQMLDYKVSYDNQRTYSVCKFNKNKKGSPARLFTDIHDACKIEIPRLSVDDDNEYYHYCDMCEKYTFKENRHCFKCSACTSKDGGEYKHCDKCLRCVKATYEHCGRCKRCHLKSVCNQEMSENAVGLNKRRQMLPNTRHSFKRTKFHYNKEY